MRLISIIETHMNAFMFLLMCLGLILSSLFLSERLITGDNWVTVCSVLFGAMSVGTKLPSFSNREPKERPV